MRQEARHRETDPHGLTAQELALRVLAEIAESRASETPERQGEPATVSPQVRQEPPAGDLERLPATQGSELEARVLAVLRAGEVHTTRSLALRLGIPVPRPGEGASLFVVLGDLLDRREIATDPKTLTFRFRAPDGDPPPPHDSRTKGDAP